MTQGVRIPVFLSCPSTLSTRQEEARLAIVQALESLQLEPAGIGRNEYPTELPLREVYMLARRCYGGVILGFEQFRSDGGILKRETSTEARLREPTLFATPWNQIEAGILYALRVPLLIFRESGITGGVFDPGVSDVFVQDMPAGSTTPQDPQLTALMLKWHVNVRERYYAD